ncbi:putative DNA repair protein [Trabulsiella guamensis ATCC 49490]|uniref:Putative DNA repair protein n=1 Tax=Trabulsiella guamensis ATCC 49490 TaxID=1005994 RepID=A0A085APW1_9ENTR|nr:2-oxo-tetronate isomerase [Trabulsiella guamensis]KFC12256.1 putative DNA repair protein [Trabulsiella guamensis ATCC 49490]
MSTPSFAVASELGRVLVAKQLQLATAESCTGGLIASALCAADDTPSFYGSGFITYTDDAKITLLGVSRETIRTFTAVSEQTVREMAAGAKQRSGADVSLAVSGYAGPDGGEDGTPAGTVWFAWQLAQDEIHTSVKRFDGDSESVLAQATSYAMAALILLLAEYV